MEFDRSLIRPTRSFFLFGPRGTGKTTWLKKHFPEAVRIDFLESKRFLEFKRSPEKIHEIAAALKPDDWIVLDEVQKVPEILNEVHRSIEDFKVQFALSGSSARKLKRNFANLLGGRAIQRTLYPLTYREQGNVGSIEDSIGWGNLPLIIQNPQDRVDLLASYLENYLKQELIEEGIIRNLDPFIRFLAIAGQMNGQILNIENIARDSQISRTTVQKYFEVLYDTLLAYTIPVYQPKIKVKEAGHPKFYFFDPGVARASAGYLGQSLDSQQMGYYFENFIINEVRAANDYLGCRKNLLTYRISGSYEIDLIIEVKKGTQATKSKIVCIEIKNSKKWDWRFSEPILDFSAKGNAFEVIKQVGIYRGSDRLKKNSFEVYPVEEFLSQLHLGEFFKEV